MSKRETEVFTLYIFICVFLVCKLFSSSIRGCWVCRKIHCNLSRTLQRNKLSMVHVISRLFFEGGQCNLLNEHITKFLSLKRFFCNPCLSQHQPLRTYFPLRVQLSTRYYRLSYMRIDIFMGHHVSFYCIDRKCSVYLSMTVSPLFSLTELANFPYVCFSPTCYTSEWHVPVTWIFVMINAWWCQAFFYCMIGFGPNLMFLWDSLQRT